ncbi:MAG: Unknown protein [uncultured Campylobacterales bacterium]|uniref:Uncharacterized protein n=1 Tax=uncultured Campylobacterales bacterium TaxID=352960 RepID=A0A6S6S537_9BACT|nr:MAG: Unknown protein [uncultured Campylobacterales bacterium]
MTKITQLLKSFFMKSQKSDIPNDINLAFGQQTHNVKTSSQKDAWDESVKLFEKAEYLKGYENIFEYVKWYEKDGSYKNITLNQSENKIDFKISQGSVLIIGTADKDKLIADVDMAKLDSINSALLRKVLEKNVKYVYSKFYLNENNHLGMKLRLDNSKMTANKIWHGIKELATNADKEDDLLMNDFKIKRSSTDHIKQLSKEIKDTKIKYLKSWIDENTKLVESLNHHDYSSLIGYSWLELLFRIDYIIAPQGKMEDEIYQILDEYYNDREQKSMEEHNSVFSKKFNELKEKDNEFLSESLFAKKITFLNISKEEKSTIQEFLEKDITATKWYEENSHKDLAIKIYDYKIFFCLYKFEMPIYMLKLMHLYVQVRHHQMFKDLGSKKIFVKDDKLKSSSIKKEIDKISKEYKKIKESDDEEFKHSAFKNSLEFGSQYEFCSSFVKSLIDL